MKILHLIDSCLPDGLLSWRVEKSAISAANRGHDLFFGGPATRSNKHDTFIKKYQINWTFRARRGFPYDWHCVKKQIGKVLREIRPDIIHANNIFSAKMISEFDLPFVYDDHEYWSSYVKRLIEWYNSTKNDKRNANGLKKILRPLAMRFLNSNFLRLGLKWEKELVSSAPTITVSSNIAEELMELGNTTKVFVTPNYPLREEIKEMLNPCLRNELSCVYAGMEGKGKSMPHRNIEGFVDTFYKFDVGKLTMMGMEDPKHREESRTKVRYTGFLPRAKMYEEMNNQCIGLIPFKKHWSHKYVSPNKAYEYAHAGLYVMCTSSLVTIFNILGGENCMTFDNYDEMAAQLEHLKNSPEVLHKKRLSIFRFAKNNLVWENHERNIFASYQMC